jgi:hypothetical protein
MNHSPEYVEQLNAMVRAKGFLGREFLTWLWYLAEEEREPLKAESRHGALEFDVWLGDRLVLEAATGLALEHVIKGGDPSQSQEAYTALTNGKSVRELKLGITIQGYGDYTATLHCDDLNPRSLKLPQPDDDTAEEGAPRELPIVLRLQQTDAFLAALDGLFARFLQSRTAEGWEDGELKDIREWVRRRQKAAAPSDLH